MGNINCVEFRSSIDLDPDIDAMHTSIISHELIKFGLIDLICILSGPVLCLSLQSKRPLGGALILCMPCKGARSAGSLNCT